MSNDTEYKLHVFLCHSSHDKPAVRELYKRLLTENWIDPWLDEEKLLPGQDWNLEIEKYVESAEVVIVCLSNNSVTKEGYIQRELKFALDIALEKPEGTIFIIPLRLEDCEPPRRLRAWQYTDYFPLSNRENSLARLLASLKKRAVEIGVFKESYDFVSIPDQSNFIKETKNDNVSNREKKNNRLVLYFQSPHIIFFDWFIYIAVFLLLFLLTVLSDAIDVRSISTVSIFFVRLLSVLYMLARIISVMFLPPFPNKNKFIFGLVVGLLVYIFVYYVLIV